MISTKIKSILIFIIKLAVIAALLWYLVSSGKLKWEYLRVPSENWGLLALAVGMLLTVFIIGFIRFKLILAGADVHISYFDSFRIGSIALLFTIFALGLLTGDAARLGYTIKASGKRAGAVAGLLVDRFIGLLGLLTVGGCTLLLNWQTVLVTPQLHAMSLGVTGLFVGFGFAGFIALVSLTRGRRSAGALWLAVSAVTTGVLWWIFSRQGLAFAGPAEGSAAPGFAAAVLRGRLLMVLGADFLVALAALLIAPELTHQGAVGLFISRRVPLGDKLMSLVNSLFGYRGHFARLFACLLISICIHSLMLGSLVVISRAVELAPAPTVGQVFFAGAPSYVAGTMPLPVGALGVGETIFDYLLSRCRVAGQAIKGGAGVFLLGRGWRLLLTLLLGVPFYLKSGKGNPTKSHSPPPMKSGVRSCNHTKFP